MENAPTWFFPHSFHALLEHFIKEHEMKKEKTKWVHYPKENTSKNALALYLIYRAAAAVWYAFASPAHPNKCHLKQASNIRISYDGGQTLRRPRVQMLKLFGRVSSMKNGEELKKTPIIIFLSSCIKKRSIVLRNASHNTSSNCHKWSRISQGNTRGRKKTKQLCCCCTM